MAQPFEMVEKAVKELIEARYEAAQGKVGGDMSFEAGEGFYVWIGLVPGGSTNETQGEWVLDIDVFGDAYGTAMGHALGVEGALIGSRLHTPTMRLDNCYQNEGPAERPWDDESVYRIGATYTFTARRPSSA